MARMWIVVGDATTGDGRVLTGAPSTDIEGRPVARVGDRTSCRRHGGNFAIVTGDDTVLIDGQPVAREGDALACGCRLIAGKQSLVHVDQGRSAGASAPTPLLRSAINLWKPSAPADALPLKATPTTAAAQESGRRDGVTLRIGVFFDGTNNNAANVAQGQSCRDSSAQALGQDAETREAIAAHCKPYMLKEGSSYDNGITNIARLFELYRDDLGEPPEEGREEVSLRVYVEGIGTRIGESDQLLSQGFGGGESGVLAKVERAFGTLIRDQLELFLPTIPIWM
ncbi:MAG: hypothetical protein GAK43_00034 [Stenotrophomonas maltophilia]|nr:MAG: hypothetical protein GAK43_00034 [Stenotrophomonas maltophilia]